jgi:hypothetical protein
MKIFEQALERVIRSCSAFLEEQMAGTKVYLKQDSPLMKLHIETPRVGAFEVELERENDRWWRIQSCLYSKNGPIIEYKRSK